MVHLLGVKAGLLNYCLVPILSLAEDLLCYVDLCSDVTQISHLLVSIRDTLIANVVFVAPPSMHVVTGYEYELDELEVLVRADAPHT